MDTCLIGSQITCLCRLGITGDRCQSYKGNTRHKVSKNNCCILKNGIRRAKKLTMGWALNDFSYGILKTGHIQLDTVIKDESLQANFLNQVLSILIKLS